jgi:hypothetical protein
MGFESRSKENEVSCLYGKGELVENLSQRLCFRSLKKDWGWKAAQEEVAGYEIRQNQLAMLLEDRWRLEVSLLQTLSCAGEVIIDEVKPAKVIQIGDPLRCWVV